MLDGFVGRGRAGSIKWQENRPFDVRDLGQLAQHRDRMPGAGPDSTLLVVSRTGSTVDGLPVLGPSDLLTAYHGPGRRDA